MGAAVRGTPSAAPERSIVSATTTAANGVVLEVKSSRVPLYERSDYRHSGVLGSSYLVYGYRRRIVSHPFRVGDVVQLGKGRNRWRVRWVGAQSVSLNCGKSNRAVEYADLTRLAILP